MDQELGKHEEEIDNTSAAGLSDSGTDSAADTPIAAGDMAGATADASTADHESASTEAESQAPEESEGQAPDEADGLRRGADEAPDPHPRRGHLTSGGRRLRPQLRSGRLCHARLRL